METEKPKHKWSGLGYEQVPGLANRVVARYLRGQRRNMERFFTERGLHDSAERMRQIRLSRQGMMAKNRMFQEVLTSYAKLASESTRVGGETSPQAISEAANLEGAPSADVVLPAEAAGHPSGPTQSNGNGTDTGGGVSEVAHRDNDDGLVVIEE